MATRPWETEEYYRKIADAKATKMTYQYTINDGDKQYHIYIAPNYRRVVSTTMHIRDFDPEFLKPAPELTDRAQQPIALEIMGEKSVDMSYVDTLVERYMDRYYPNRKRPKKGIFRPKFLTTAAPPGEMTSGAPAAIFVPKVLTENYCMVIDNLSADNDYDELKDILKKAGMVMKMKVFPPREVRQKTKPAKKRKGRAKKEELAYEVRDAPPEYELTTRAYVNYMTERELNRALELFNGFSYRHLVWRCSVKK